MGNHGYSERNQRGDRLFEFLPEQNLFAMNNFLKKKPQRKWTWISPDGNTKNEIESIIANRKEIVHDVGVVNKVSVGSDHRLMKAKVEINTKKERRSQ